MKPWFPVLVLDAGVNSSMYLWRLWCPSYRSMGGLRDLLWFIWSTRVLRLRRSNCLGTYSSPFGWVRLIPIFYLEGFIIPQAAVTTLSSRFVGLMGHQFKVNSKNSRFRPRKCNFEGEARDTVDEP